MTRTPFSKTDSIVLSVGLFNGGKQRKSKRQAAILSLSANAEKTESYEVPSYQRRSNVTTDPFGTELSSNRKILPRKHLKICLPSELVLNRLPIACHRSDSDHRLTVVVCASILPPVAILSEKEPTCGRTKGDNRSDCRFRIDEAIAKLLSQSCVCATYNSS